MQEEPRLVPPRLVALFDEGAEDAPPDRVLPAARQVRPRAGRVEAASSIAPGVRGGAQGVGIRANPPELTHENSGAFARKIPPANQRSGPVMLGGKIRVYITW